MKGLEEGLSRADEMILQGGPHRLNEGPASSPRCQRSSERQEAGMLPRGRQPHLTSCVLRMKEEPKFGYSFPVEKKQ